ncbi:hypothetical protein NHP190012_11080 [Helicobacter sp. NHP19-012]|uniref:Beta-lactamase n=1 Tax=Helicobacter gastrofelis TaxID=2849642 RepID=A0ABN6I7A9_9HELI|nr:hypothetical protein [Helicobacter sp. NHP19-012]BCZ19466.1 hypothetical protein NHP190012_11080 [Helicobacter sp. NHP19-012]
MFKPLFILLLGTSTLIATPPIPPQKLFATELAGEGAQAVDRTNQKVQKLLYEAMLSFIADKAKAKAFYQQAGDLGSALATTQLANFYNQASATTTGGVIKNDPDKYLACYEKALKLYQAQRGSKTGAASLRIRAAIAEFYALTNPMHSQGYISKL